ncbi:MAG: GNAT family N-acetyltransferase [Candidatus Methanoperedens sp.]|nr:GNAT family N-acetyltransferase [Candidatus Methanoperedens sp.]
MGIEIRRATKENIQDIKKLLSFYILDTETIEKNLPEFIIAVSGGKIVGCACLDTGNILELRSIAVLPGYHKRGIGSKLVEAILDRAASLKSTVYARTTSPGFFEKKGFKRLENEEKKVLWKDCADCDKFDICRQAVMRIDM